MSRRNPEPDRDNPEWTEADFARARPPSALSPELLAQFPRTKRGRGPQKAPTKVQVAVRLSPDIVDRLKAGGPGWHRRMDDLLRQALGL